MITDGPTVYLVKRHDGKKLNLRTSRMAAFLDISAYHDENDFEVEPISPSALLWWSPRIKPESDHEPYAPMSRQNPIDWA